MKAARLDNLPGCTAVLAASIYDTKPVHILLTVAESVQWIVKEKRVWNEEAGKK
jgi:hypothetical protein